MSTHHQFNVYIYVISIVFKVTSAVLWSTGTGTRTRTGSARGSLCSSGSAAGLRKSSDGGSRTTECARGSDARFHALIRRVRQQEVRSTCCCVSVHEAPCWCETGFAVNHQTVNDTPQTCADDPFRRGGAHAAGVGNEPSCHLQLWISVSVTGIILACARKHLARYKPYFVKKSATIKCMYINVLNWYLLLK